MGGSSNAARDNNAQDLLLTGFDIMARRARGEQITLAQNLFEPEPASGMMRPSVEQGDRDQDGTRIVLASAPPPARLAKIQIVEPETTRLKSSKSAKADKADKKKSGEWAVQVGSFKSKRDAKEQLSFVQDRFSRHFSKADGQIADRSAGAYRSRFSGFTESSAKAACSAMKAKKLACQVIAPS
jgi:D-alanyl-D-alanine carboxypeptidase (penicillin-binding protein 5/6)